MSSDIASKLDALRLPALALICGLLLSIAYSTLRPTIIDNRAQFEARQLLDILQTDAAGIEEVLPDVFAVTRQDGSRVWIFDAVTHDGYNGRIALWVGVGESGIIEGVRVKSHEETPGLGDKIELAVSDWILDFNGYGTRTPARAWDVKRRGGDFDQFTGATITPRAVIHAVRDAVAVFEAEQTRWEQAADGR